MQRIEVIISIGCALGSFISFLLARLEKHRAKKSEQQAKQYADNANEVYLAAKNLFSKINEEFQKRENFDLEIKKVKKYLQQVYDANNPLGEFTTEPIYCGIVQVMNDVYHNEVDKSFVLSVLNSLMRSGMIVDARVGGNNDFTLFNITRNF